MANQGFLEPKRGFATTAIHSGVHTDTWSGAIVPPIVTATSFKHSSQEYNVCSRFGNPTMTALEECLARLDGGKHAMTFASGLGATTTVVSLLSKGDHLISTNDLYGGTSRLFREFVTRKGIDVSMVDCSNADILAKTLQKNTKMIFIETPTNPILNVLDIAGICKLAKSFGNILVVVDNTFLTPYFQRPLDFGADIALYSITKYMNGHCDVLMGATVVNDDRIAEKLRFLQHAMGAVPSPIDCYLVSRGLKTLALRMEQHQKSSLIIAQWLQKHPQVHEVFHPGLPTHPQYEITKRQTSGHSGVFSFRHYGGINESEAFLYALKLFSFAVTLGGYQSLAKVPALITHASLPIEERLELGITDNLVRLSIGLEDTEDLLDDLEQAFKVAFPDE